MMEDFLRKNLGDEQADFYKNATDKEQTEIDVNIITILAHGKSRQPVSFYQEKVIIDGKIKMRYVLEAELQLNQDLQIKVLNMIYDDESAEKLFIEAKKVYEDRGMLKWIGFYLSDQTAAINKDVKDRSRVNPKKEQLDGEEINRILNEARIKSKPVAIQLNSVNADAQYSDDVTGMIRGYDSLGIYVDNKRVLYDEIRNVEFYDWHKWSELK